MSKVEDIRRKLGNVCLTPQTPDREIQLARLKWDLDEVMAKRTLAVIGRTRILLRGYEKCGSMSVIFSDGSQKTEHPEVGGSPIQHAWNAINLAERLAMESIPWE